jgi:hypothetical protein
MLEGWSKGSEWSSMLDLVSPKFFDVLPARELQREIRTLVANSLHRSRYVALRARLETATARCGLPVWLSADQAHVARDPAIDRDQALLRLYFLQLMASPEALLDLRYERFREVDRGLVWEPRPLYVCWEPGFLDRVRRLYVAFYEEGEQAFRAALRELDLAPAEQSLRESFGGTEQRAVVFRTGEFRRAFHRAFLECQHGGSVLHRHFASLGLYLGCLYQHLEAVGGAHDVRAAFAAVRECVGRG